MTNTMIVQPDNIYSVAKALRTRTRLKILKVLFEKEFDISSLAVYLGKSLGGTCDNVQILEKEGLITIHFIPGGHGIRKICSTNIKRVVFNLH